MSKFSVRMGFSSPRGRPFRSAVPVLFGLRQSSRGAFGGAVMALVVVASLLVAVSPARADGETGRGTSCTPVWFSPSVQHTRCQLRCHLYITGSLGRAGGNSARPGVPASSGLGAARVRVDVREASR